MISVSETEPKMTSRKKTITVKNVCIVNNQLVDTQTGETDVLTQLAAEFPEGVEEFKFKITFDLPDNA